MRSHRLPCRIAAAVLSVAAVAPASAHADDSAALELGARTGYALPLGGLGTKPYPTLSDNVSNYVVGVVPIWLDASWRFNPKLVAGAYFQYGIGTVNGNLTGDCQNNSYCSARDILVGLQVQYHLLGEGRVDPWVGIGAGYEELDYSMLGGGDWNYSFRGFDFAVVQLGIDIRPVRNLSIGPNIVFNVGRFLSYCAAPSSPSLPCTTDGSNVHEWLTLGIEGAYDISVAR
jgi:outer membrane protein W